MPVQPTSPCSQKVIRIGVRCCPVSTGSAPARLRASQRTCMPCGQPLSRLRIQLKIGDQFQAYDLAPDGADFAGMIQLEPYGCASTIKFRYVCEYGILAYTCGDQDDFLAAWNAGDANPDEYSCAGGSLVVPLAGIPLVVYDCPQLQVELHGIIGSG